jgi:putative endonuclease
MNNRRTGRRGEEVALDYLLRKGFSLLERNYTALEGEIDLILKEGECLVFVEVKMRRGEEFGDPVEAVDWRKQGTIRRVAERYRRKRAGV